MAETMCAGPIHRASEFALVGGTTRLFGACGPDALATVLSNALGRDISTADVYTAMAAANLLMAVLPDRNAGMSNSGQWHDAAANIYGATITAFRGYAEPWADWATFFNTHAGHSPMVVEVARNWLIRDEISGLGQNANTDPTSPNVSRYHIFAVVGRHDGGFSPHAGRVLPPGYWCADGDNLAGGNDSAHNFQAADVLQFYSDATMANAQPCAALAIAGQGSVTSMATADPTPFFTVSADGQTYTDTRTKQELYKGAFDALVKAGDTRPVISGTKLLAGADATTSRFIVGSLDTGDAVYIGEGPPDSFTTGFPGNALLHTEAALAALQQQFAEQTTALVTADRQIAQLQAQLAAAGTPPADPTVARNAAIGAAMLDVLSLAGVITGGK